MSQVIINDSDWVYDIETYLDIFSAGFVHARTGTRFIFESSDRINQDAQFIRFLYWLRDQKARLFGFNNISFDWTVCDHLIYTYEQFGTFTHHDARKKSNELFALDFNDWSKQVAPWNMMITQGDLMKIHHFDNSARATSLKKLEINMRAQKVIDLPYPPDQPTTSAQKDHIIEYMCHDINESLRFYLHSLEMIAFRDQLRDEYSYEHFWNGVPEIKCHLGDVLNFSDGRIGKEIIVHELTEAGTQCYAKVNGKKTPIQTIRSTIALGDIISPKVSFQHPEFQRITNFIASKTIRPDQTKGFFGSFDTLVRPTGQVETRDKLTTDEKKWCKENGVRRLTNSAGDGKVSAIVNGFQYDFGTGGIHGSVHDTAVHECDEWEIWDWDVASYYPNLAITHGWYPEHLGKAFVDVYDGVYQRRKGHAKGTSMNLALKFGLNVPYGQSNANFSPFFDPQYTMSITINGQLLLCMLAEWLTHVVHETRGLISIDDCVQVIQANTDGMTLRVRKTHIEWMHNVCKEWEEHTGLTLESAQYDSMWVRDVNSYMARKKDGKVKRIGAFRIETPLDNPNTRELGWHQDHSALVVTKAVDAHLREGTDISEFIMNHRDPFDFQCSVKVNKTANREPCYLVYGKVYEDDDEVSYTREEDRIQRNTRYYVSTTGEHLYKDMVKRNSTVRSQTGIQAGWTVTITNDMDHFRWDNVNWLWYIRAAEKLTKGLS